MEEDPDAYVPNIEKLHRRREELRRIEEQYAKKAYDRDKALFDFDESVDNLSEVSERYGVVHDERQSLTEEPMLATMKQVNEEQGKGKDL